MASLTFIEIVLVLCAVYCILKIASRPAAPYPPGPKGYPIVGNLFDLPTRTQRAWETYAEWGAQYGGILRLRIANQNYIILNDPEIVNEMLDGKGTIYSDRPLPPMCKLCRFGLVTSFLQNSRLLKEHRKLFTRVIGNSQALERFNPSQEYQSSMLIKRLLAFPRDLEGAIRRTAGSLILDVAYGYNVREDGDDPLVDAANTTLNIFGEIAVPGRYLVDALPILQFVPSWLPFAGFKRLAARNAEAIQTVIDGSFEYVKQGMKHGNIAPSYVSELLTELGDSASSSEQEKLDIIKWSAGTMYSAATDTIVSTLLCYFLAMIVHPEVQQKLQAEIDQVIGRDRLPSLEDRKSGNLPYLAAVIKELLRWLPAGPLGVPHANNIDDVHRGYFIPKGSIVMANSWLFLHDPQTYKDPLSFRPERFLGPNAERDPCDFSFGYGRRRCPGNKLANMSIWIDVAKFAATLHVSKAKTSAGEAIEPVVEQSPNLISFPMPFDCHIALRHEGAEKLIEHSGSGGMAGAL